MQIYQQFFFSILLFFLYVKNISITSTILMMSLLSLKDFISSMLVWWLCTAQFQDGDGDASCGKILIYFYLLICTYLFFDVAQLYNTHLLK